MSEFSIFNFQFSIKQKKRLFIASILIILGILFRTVWHLGDNVEFVTAATLVAGTYLGLGWALAVPIVIMVITDLFLGNTNIFIFTWSAYLFIGYLSNISHLSDLKRWPKILHATGLGVIASVFFFLWTNFGVWLLDTWGMYPKTITGLLDAFILGLPFLKSNMIGNSIFVPASFLVAEMVRIYAVNPDMHRLVRIARKYI